MDRLDGAGGHVWSLIKTETLFPAGLAVAASSQPSPLKSPAASAKAPGTVAAFTATAKVPSPRPYRTFSSLLEFVVAMSSLVSWLKSPMTTEVGGLLPAK